MQRQGFDDPAADRRRHDLARAHRGQGRPEVRRPGRLGEGRLPLGAGRRGAAARRPQRPKLLADVEADYDSLRARHAGQERPADGSRSSRRARPTATPIDWDGATCRAATARPTSHAGDRARRVFDDYDLAELRDYIDWQPFFNAWEMKGQFPDILNNPATGEAARKLYDDAQAMLDQIVDEKWLHRQRRRRPLPGQRGRRRHRGLRRRDARRAC